MAEGMTVIRSELVQSLSTSKSGLTAREHDRIVELFFVAISDQLAKGGRVELRGGTDADLTEAREWISLFMHDAVPRAVTCTGASARSR